MDVLEKLKITQTLLRGGYIDAAYAVLEEIVRHITEEVAKQIIDSEFDRLHDTPED